MPDNKFVFYFQVFVQLLISNEMIRFDKAPDVFVEHFDLDVVGSIFSSELLVDHGVYGCHNF